ncbi:PREDICTED: transmembrane protein 256-like [Polistes dominula]|uniref:Transmembrane protein 256-like n=1 Tax=Polistes dominula TaxID=743375 RepID=A0ABM1ID58_POLDO|nr:PREDICTED: transmembrane protein 256-like [Polistes dominula]
MGIADAMNYILFTNPISSGTFLFLRGTARMAGDYMGLEPKQEIKMPQTVQLWKLSSALGPYVKLAGLSGAIAVSLGAYGAHNINAEKFPEQAKIFDTANRYHFFHTLALLGAPLCRRPGLATIFFLSGIIMFSGNCYYIAFTNDKRFSRMAPIGGTCLILGWLSLIL